MRVKRTGDDHWIPAAMSQQNAGVLGHFLLGVPNIEQAVKMYAGTV